MAIMYPSDFIGPLPPGAQRYSSDFIGPPAPISVQKANQQAPAPQQSSGGGGGAPNPYTTYINGTKLADLIGEGKYDANGNPIGGGGGGQSEQDITNQINESYNPAYANLSAVEQQYRQEYPTSQQFIENSFAEVKPQIEAEQSAKLGDLATQRTKGQAEEKNQFAAARRRFNELRTGLLTRFGGASSTGEAGQELLGRTTAEQMGKTQENFGNLYQDISKEEMNTKNFYTAKLTNLEKEKQNKLQTLKNDFDAAIRNINTQRATLDSEKAARRVSALQAYAAEARKVQYDARQAQQQLQMWIAAKDEAINLAKQFQAKSFTIPGMPGKLGAFTIGGINNGTSGSGVNGLTPEQAAALGLTPETAKGQYVTYGRPEEDPNDPFGLNLK